MKEKGIFEVPIIKNLHSKLLEVTSEYDALHMGSWHKCNTTHCRAGWIVHLGGEQGYALESNTNTLFAANQIIKASSKIRIPFNQFFKNNKEAMIDIKKAAALELKENS